MNEPSCGECKTGEIHLSNYYSMKNKEISKAEFLKREKVLGDKCFYCMYNTFGKRKSKLIKQVIPSFKSLDLFEQKESVKK